MKPDTQPEPHKQNPSVAKAALTTPGRVPAPCARTGHTLLRDWENDGSRVRRRRPFDLKELWVKNPAMNLQVSLTCPLLILAMVLMLTTGAEAAAPVGQSRGLLL